MHLISMHALGLALLSCLIAVPLARSEAIQQVVEVHASTGQQLADAVAAWGASGSNMTILIDVPYISMRNACFTNYSTIAARSRVQPFSQGMLTIRGQATQDPSQPATVLDAGMRSGLFPVALTYPARYSLEQLVLINLCEVQYGVFYLQGSTPPTPFGVELFGLTSTYQSQWLVDIAMYGRRPAVAYAGYRIVMEQSSHIAELNNFTTPVVQGTEQTFLDIDGSMSSAHDLFVKYYPLSLGVYKNMTYRSLANPDDPLLSQLRAEGKIMPPQRCNGTLIPQELVDAEIVPLLAPYWMASTQPDFARGLKQAAGQTAIQLAIQGPPPVLFTFTGRFGLPGTITYQVASTMFITGLRTGPRVQIDLQQQADVFNIAAGAILIIQLVEVINLLAQVPTQRPAGLSPADLLPSVFPLSAFKSAQSPDTWHNASSVVMSNTTLVIPPDDYLALLILAARQAGKDVSRCADAATIQRVAQLQAGFSVISFSLPTPDAYQHPPLFADDLQGWGLNASLLTLMPSSPVQLPSCSCSRPSRVSLALAIGLSCGGILLAAVLASGMLHLRRCERKALAAKSYSRHAVKIMMEHDGKATATAPIATASTAAGQAAQRHISTLLATQSGNIESSLQAGVRHAWDRHQRMLDTATSATPSNTSNLLLDSDDLVRQVQQMAGQLKKDDDDQLEMVDVLGSGASGTVYLGMWRGLQVAVKTIVFHERQHGSTSETEARTPRAVMEAAIAASVGHPNLVATYHYDVKALAASDDMMYGGSLKVSTAIPDASKEEAPAYKVYLVQELCGLSLAGSIGNKLFYHHGTHELDLESVLAVLLDVARGLAYLHSKGIIHGDLKPENIMLKSHSTASQGVIAKLTDFGLSMKLAPDATHVSNWSFGSPFYVAPEVVCNHHMSTASDVYSFGIVCWAVYMQHPPYLRTQQGMYVWHPLFPRFSLDRPPPQELARLLNRCLAAEPKTRPAAVNLVEHLEGLIHKE